MKSLLSQTKSALYPLTVFAEKGLRRWNNFLGRREEYLLTSPVNIYEIKSRTLNYLSSLRVTKRGKFIGYRHSKSCTKPTLYSTLAVLLIKNLYDEDVNHAEEALELVLKAQSEDGLWRDPVIECREAETEDWWGWRHLTLHALMTLALYDRPARREISYVVQFANPDKFRKFLNSLDWENKVHDSSNAIQNIGVMLQYSRDYHNSTTAGKLIDVLYEMLSAKQDSHTGLYGCKFNTPTEISIGVQAGYHFWLLYFYDDLAINHVESIIDNVLKTQNRLGGYGVKWNSSACEDIDSIDPLVRLGRQSSYRNADIQLSLQRALPALLHNFNGNGGWVFRRHESMTIGHREMFSAVNESNLFYTWFRTLGLAYCLSGLQHPPLELQYPWNFRRAPGHQFL
ncbi:MAG: hypothetical protein NTV58_17830 [Deltaproteobacteria bacterium]|nr:hypothetical protein [Deltaproteobacteria bacterium]